MHIISLSFDDGLERSNQKIAEIYERYGLSACFNVIALGHRADFVPPDPYHQGYPKGDFALWNELQDRGHEIMPHGLRHQNLAELPLEAAQQAITSCLDVFTQELKGFRSEESIYNFAYNASTPEIEAWLSGKVKAYRTGGEGLNPLPHEGQVRLTTTSYGPGNCEHHLEAAIERLLARPEGWLIYNTHGLDDEGWGAISSRYLDELLKGLTRIDSVYIMPVNRALTKF